MREKEVDDSAREVFASAVGNMAWTFSRDDSPDTNTACTALTDRTDPTKQELHKMLAEAFGSLEKAVKAADRLHTQLDGTKAPPRVHPKPHQAQVCLRLFRNVGFCLS